MCKEYKVMAGKLVFRGQCTVRMLYMDGDGVLHTEKIEMPFSQLTDLDRDYSSNADADISFFVTATSTSAGSEASANTLTEARSSSFLAEILRQSIF